MQVNEIFSSIDGEGIRTGFLTTFIRSQFCNCNCSYCDTKYSLSINDENGNKQYRDMTIYEVINECNKFENRRITFTGGEPLIQPDADDLINELTEKDYEVNIETNGAVDLKNHIDNWTTRNNIIITMDWKSPFSGMREKMIESNLNLLTDKDVLKFVVADTNDLNDMLEVVNNHNLTCNIFVSPVFGKIEGKEIVAFMHDNNLQNVRVQIQLHKYFWAPEMRGV